MKRVDVEALLEFADRMSEPFRPMPEHTQSMLPRALAIFEREYQATGERRMKAAQEYRAWRRKVAQ